MTETERNNLVDDLFQNWFDGLITEDEAIADAILKGVGPEFDQKLKSWKSQVNR